MINSLEELWKESVVAKSNALSQHLLEGLRKTTKNFSYVSRSPGRDLNQDYEFEAGVSTTPPRRLLTPI
jgi:hypothetical protein